jgi:uncharacterized protein YlzI (FlbEa/FlbD family)
MVTVTALNSLRCSLRPELVASVAAGPPTTVLLTTGVALLVRESADEVARRLEHARRSIRPAVTEPARHGGAD